MRNGFVKIRAGLEHPRCADDLCQIFIGQARLPAFRVERGLPADIHSLANPVRVYCEIFRTEALG